MSKPPIDLDLPPGFGRIKGLDDLAGLSGMPGKGSEKPNLTESIARKLATKNAPPPPPAASADQDRSWTVQKQFIALFDKLGKPFARFIGDLLDILMSGPLQDKLVNELIEEKLAQQRRTSSDTGFSAPADEPAEDRKGGRKVPPPRPTDNEVKIGGELRVRPRHFLKRKRLFSSLFLDAKEISGCRKVMKSLAQICEEEKPPFSGEKLDRDGRRNALREVMGRLRLEITRPDLLAAWMLLEADDFAEMEWVFTETRELGLVRPTYYDDLDKAYRDAKKLLKLLIDEFSEQFPPGPEKQRPVLDYLHDILEVYTHHHFVVKSFNRTRPTSSKQEIEARERELHQRLEELRSENDRLREEKRRLVLDREGAMGEAASLRRETEEIRGQFQKLNPDEVARQLKSLDVRINQLLKEKEAMVEEDTELRTAMRQLDAENQKMLQQLRDLNAIPDESDKSVADLLVGKRVVIFGGVGRDHYMALLKEAGVKDADYEWYEGYKTISQNRTAEIVRRCDLVVVITAYAGHLHTWQTRATCTDQQTLVYIHNSGTGTLRQQIIEKFRKREGN